MFKICVQVMQYIENMWVCCTFIRNSSWYDSWSSQNRGKHSC